MSAPLSVPLDPQWSTHIRTFLCKVKLSGDPSKVGHEIFYECTCLLQSRSVPREPIPSLKWWFYANEAFRPKTQSGRSRPSPRRMYYGDWDTFATDFEQQFPSCVQIHGRSSRSSLCCNNHSKVTATITSDCAVVQHRSAKGRNGRLAPLCNRH